MRSIASACRAHMGHSLPLRSHLGIFVLTLCSRMTASMSASACCIWLFLTGATCFSGLRDVSAVAAWSSCGTPRRVISAGKGRCAISGNRDTHHACEGRATPCFGSPWLCR